MRTDLANYEKVGDELWRPVVGAYNRQLLVTDRVSLEKARKSNSPKLFQLLRWKRPL